MEPQKKINSKQKGLHVMENVRNLNITRQTHEDLFHDFHTSWEILRNIRGKDGHLVEYNFSNFLTFFDRAVEEIESNAWEFCEEVPEAGKRFFKLADLGRHFSATWKDKTPSTSDELEEVEEVRECFFDLSRNPFKVSNWEKLEKFAGAEVFENAGETVTRREFGDCVDVGEVCKEAPKPLIKIVNEEEQDAIRSEALKKSVELIVLVESYNYLNRQNKDLRILNAMHDKILMSWGFNDVEDGVRCTYRKLKENGSPWASGLVEIFELYRNKRAAE